MANRPILITIVAILYALSGLISVLDGVVGGINYDQVIIGIITLVIAGGLFGGWKIIWYIALIFASLNILLDLYILITTGTLSAGIVTLIINLVIVFYLTRSGVKEFFNI